TGWVCHALVPPADPVRRPRGVRLRSGAVDGPPDRDGGPRGAGGVAELADGQELSRPVSVDVVDPRPARWRFAATTNPRLNWRSPVSPGAYPGAALALEAAHARSVVAPRRSRRPRPRPGPGAATGDGAEPAPRARRPGRCPVQQLRPRTRLPVARRPRPRLLG